MSVFNLMICDFFLKFDDYKESEKYNVIFLLTLKIGYISVIHAFYIKLDFDNAKLSIFKW